MLNMTKVSYTKVSLCTNNPNPIQSNQFHAVFFLLLILYDVTEF